MNSTSLKSIYTVIVLFQIFFAALLAFAAASPVPEPKAKPGLLAAGYSAPLVAAAPAYTAYSAYSAPLAYSAGYVAPSVYSAGYAYPYSSPYVVG